LQGLVRRRSLMFWEILHDNPLATLENKLTNLSYVDTSSKPALEYRGMNGIVYTRNVCSLFLVPGDY
jgi:hypothetical protein